MRVAIKHLAYELRLVALSSLYETEPVELANQPWFLNCIAAVETEKTPRELLQFIISIEEGMGRLRLVPKGPRKIDIDIVLMGDLAVDESSLILPHPAMHQRRFVLEALAEIAPDALHPVLGKTIRQLLAELPPGQTVRRISPPNSGKS